MVHEHFNSSTPCDWRESVAPMSDQHKVPPTLQNNFPEVVLQHQRVEVLPVFTFEWDTNGQLNTMASQFPVSFIFS